MKEGKSSSTAWGVTLARVAHVHYDAAPPIFDDSLALELVEPEIQPKVRIWGKADVWVRSASLSPEVSTWSIISVRAQLIQSVKNIIFLNNINEVYQIMILATR